MTTNPTASVWWSTSSLGDLAQTSASESAALREHLALCRGSERCLFALQCAAECMRGFVVTRFVTTLMLVALAIGAASLVL